MDLDLDYPDDDLDAMLDEELDVRNELEKENELSQRPTASLGGSKLHESNVGIGQQHEVLTENNQNSQGSKRMRSDGDDEHLNWNSIEDEMDLIKATERSPGTKRMKILDGGAKVLNDISNKVPRKSPIKAFKEKTVFKSPPFGDFQAVSCQDGGRFYLRLAGESERQLSVETKQKCFQSAGLCGSSYYSLYEEANGELNRLETAALTRQMEPRPESTEEPAGELWVEKYKPRSYIDLLSDDGTNRTLLMWLKLWDKLVFNKDRKVKPKKDEDVNKPKYPSALPDVEEEFDSLGRPVQTVALLHGPPGLGKTTLAHIVAKHAGYKVVEMNASDDRSLETFTKKFESATQMKSVVTEDKRPICLIIDEIDGSPAPTINYLVSAITGKLAEKKKKGGDKIVVRRPIICICNELFTPALRPLRKVALVVPFPPTLASRLASRLKEITMMEKLNADLTALLALCKKSDNDIRSCLSTLQFFKKQCKSLRTSDVAGVNVGSKDSHKSALKVLDDIFAIPRGENDRDSKQKISSVGERYKKILATIQSCGEYERVVGGVFDNYVNMKFKDMRLENVTRSLDWFTSFDLMQQEIRHSQIYSLMAYLPYTLVLSHLNFGSTVKQRVNIQSQAVEVNQKVEQSKNVLTSLVSEMTPTARVYCSRTSLVRELLPAILSVIQPSLRPVNTQLFSAREKAELENVVAVHVAYNLTYQQEKDETGQYVYKMDPDVESIVCYPGTKRMIQLTYGIKQLIAREVEIEKMRLEGGSGKEPRSVTPTQEMDQDIEHTPRGSKKTTNHLQKLTAKPVEFKTKAPTDFFGRALKVDPKKTENKNNVIKSDIWFKFKEGYSNAVRRNLKVKEFV